MKNYFNLLLHSDFDRALFNFRLSLKLEPPTIGKGSRARLQGQKHPPGSRTSIYYRPVVILSILDKVFEQYLNQRFENVFDPFISAYKKSQLPNCTVVPLVEDWKQVFG